MTIDNVNPVSARPVELAQLAKKENLEKINCVFDGAKPENTEISEEQDLANEIIFLKTSSYKEHCERASGGRVKFDLTQWLNFLVERGRERKDFSKLSSGELLGKMVFINKKDYKAYIKGHPEAKNNAVLIKSMKAREFIRDNAQKLGLDVHGEYKTVQEKYQDLMNRYKKA